ncbi:hypothetical protein BH11PAT2_BH11PAT2_03500 [soil metagenome]
MGEGFKQFQEPHRKPTEEAVVAATIQELEVTGAALEALQQNRRALAAYQLAHPELQIDTQNPKNNSGDVRNAAMMEWVLSESASKFNASVQDNPTGVDLKANEREALQESLALVRDKNRESKDTLH